MLAEPSGDQPGPPATSAWENPDLSRLPGAEDISQGVAQVEREEGNEAEQLNTPGAIREREESGNSYADLTSSEAEQLLGIQFGEQLDALNSDPARFLSDAKLDDALGKGVATVTSNGDSQLLDASIPVRVQDKDGDLSKVDLSLQPTSGGFEPANPVTAVSIPSSAEESIEVGEGEVALQIAQAGAEESDAHRYGDKNIFYPEVQTDADLMASPTSTGVELFDQLRSEDSPETLRFTVGLPAETALRSDGAGGAEVAEQNGSPLALIPSPTAVDAQGSTVPVDLEVEESSIVLRVPHRGHEFAYPILVDPIVEDWANAGWYAGWNLQTLTNGAWKFYSNNSHILGRPWCYRTCWGSTYGLYVAAENVFFGPEQYGQWSYSTPNPSSYISHAWITPFYRQNYNCTSAQPHDYDGIWSPSAGWRPLHVLDALSGQSSMDASTTSGESFVIGLGTGEPGVWIQCWREMLAGGVAIWLDDTAAPRVEAVTGMPAGWVNSSTPLEAAVWAIDDGLGVQDVKLSSSGGPTTWRWDQPACTGLYESRCPTSKTGHIQFGAAGLAEGKSTATIQAVDPTGKVSGVKSFEMLVDRTSPLINLSGQLAKVTAEEGKEELSQGGGSDQLALPTYKLKIEATDGDATHLRSGVKEIKVYLDGKTTPEETKSQACPAGSCPLTMSYTLKLPGLTGGKHTLKIVAIDQAGNETKPERKIEFEYFPATGIKDDYVLQHIPLPDGHDYSNEKESHGPEIAINVTNGNLVYHERDLQVETGRAKLELERFYNSQLPAEKDTQWGHGWTVAQAPELVPKLNETPAKNATMLQASGAIAGTVRIPDSESQDTFDPKLNATISKTSGGGYEVASEKSGEVDVFNNEGRIEESRSGGTLSTPPSPPAVAATTLCKSSAQRPECVVEDRYRAKASLSASSTSATLETSLGSVKCMESILKGEVNAEAGAPLSASVSVWTLASCKLGSTSCTITTSSLPSPASIESTASDSGSLIVGASGWSEPGWKVSCGSALNCTFGFKPVLVLEGGSPAHLVAAKKAMSRSGTACPSSATFTATYQFGSPQSLYIEGLGFPTAEPTLKYSYSGTALTKIAINERVALDKPSIDIGVTAGLVSSAQGDDAGSDVYGYQSGKLVAKQATAGETKYGYDSSNRLTSIKLPNGTEASVVYDTTSRVTEVTVKATGEAAKVTHFWYGAEPRETRVWGGGNPEVTYSIGEDGSVFKWAYAEVAPAFDSLGGSLWVNRNNFSPIENGDHNLVVTASSPHEIASIQVLVDGDTLADEKTCEDNSSPPAHNCEHVKLEWVTNTAAHPPGVLDLEVLTTDFLGHSAAEHFFVTVPPPPPPPSPGEPTEPTFEQIKQFREEFGLDLDLQGSLEEIEEQTSARIWELSRTGFDGDRFCWFPI